MALNKYDRLGPQKDYSWQTYIPQLPQLDFDLLNQTLQQQQTQVDFAKGISERSESRSSSTEPGIRV